MIENPKVAIYLRVATNNQNDSLKEQEDRIKRLCSMKGYEIFKTYTDIGSAKDKNRIGYQQMLKDLQTNQFDKIIAYKVDRISRSIIDLGKFLTNVKQHNCSVAFISEDIDTSSAVGSLYLRMLNVFSEFEKEVFNNE